MKSINRSWGLLYGLVLCILSPSLQAAWSRPTHHSELNDHQQLQVATQPCISSDGLSIFFVREDPSLVNHNGRSYFIFEATRDSVELPFENQRALTELGNNGNHIASPWISPDGLRLYYAEAVVYHGRWQRLIKMAVRNSIGQHWTVSRTFYELHGDYIDTEISLNSDETLIMWSDINLENVRRIHTASRPSVSLNFSNIQEATELNDIEAMHPFMSADGLMVYFTQFNAEGRYQLWSGVRFALDEPFGDFLPMESINQPDVNFTTPCLGPDGSALYFYKGAPEMDKMDKGIYVSDWVDTPYDIAMRNLDEAVKAKRQARLLLDKAATNEIAAVRALRQVRPEDLPQGVTVKQLHQARIAIYQALHRQFIGRKNICRALDYLNDALTMLDASMAQEVPADEGIADKDNRGRIARQLKPAPNSKSKQKQPKK